MKVKFYDQKLKLGRKLFCFVAVVGWILLVVMRICLFLLFSKAQPTPLGLGTLGFLGGACSKQVLMWGKLSPGQSKGMVGCPPSATVVAFERATVSWLFQSRTYVWESKCVSLHGTHVLGVWPGTVSCCEQSNHAKVRAIPSSQPPL